MEIFLFVGLILVTIVFFVFRSDVQKQQQELRELVAKYRKEIRDLKRDLEPDKDEQIRRALHALSIALPTNLADELGETAGTMVRIVIRNYLDEVLDNATKLDTVGDRLTAAATETLKYTMPEKIGRYIGGLTRDERSQFFMKIVQKYNGGGGQAAVAG